jgi:hypothetical protein
MFEYLHRAILGKPQPKKKDKNKPIKVVSKKGKNEECEYCK